MSATRGPPPRDREDAVLLVVQEPVTARYLSELRDAMPERRFAFTRVPLFGPGSAIPDAREIPFREASARRWPVAVFADHHAAWFFDRAERRVRISHGLSGAKLVRREPYTVGPRFVFDRRGRPLYDRIFVSGRYERALAREHIPALVDRVVVVGDPYLDRLLAADRSEARRAMGVGDARVVLVASTWGPRSLFARFGPALVAQAAALAARSGHRFVFARHPKCDRRALPSPHPGVSMLPPGADLERVFAAADLGLFDHTSVAGYFACSRRPLAFVPIARGALVEDAPVARLAATRPRLSRPEDLAAVLGAAEREAPLEAEAILEFADPVGGAHARIRAEIEGLLRADSCRGSRR